MVVAPRFQYATSPRGSLRGDERGRFGSIEGRCHDCVSSLWRHAPRGLLTKLSQETDDGLCAVGEQFWDKVAAGSSRPHLAKSGIWPNCARHSPDLQTQAYRHDPWLYQIARMWPDNRCSQDFSVPSRHDLYHAGSLAFRLSPVVFGKWETEDIYAALLYLRRLFPQANMS